MKIVFMRTTMIRCVVPLWRKQTAHSVGRIQERNVAAGGRFTVQFVQTNAFGANIKINHT